MMDELINKIAADTGLPASTVTPVLGALLAHLGDVLPAPIAHHVAVALGLHQEGDAPNANAPDADASDASAQDANVPAGGGVLGGFAGELLGSGNAVPGAYPGAASLVNVAESLMGSFLAGRR